MTVLGVGLGRRRALVCASALGLVLGASTAFAEADVQQEETADDVAAVQSASQIDAADVDESDLAQDVQDVPVTYDSVTYDDVVEGDSGEQGAPEPYAGAQAWSAAASVGAASASVGQQVRVDASPAQGGFSYNFVWERGGWAEWDSNVKSTGSFTSDPSWSFAPSAPGTYRVYVDVRDDSTGEVQTVSAGSVEVSAGQWSASIELSTGTAVVGAPVTVTPRVQGVPDGTACTYNYVYNYNGTWEDWGSTVLSTGARTSQTSWQFVPQREGTYCLYIDVVLPNGDIRTAATLLKVEAGPSCAGVEASASTISQGQSVTLTPKLVNGSATDFTYNWGWERDGWVEWDSTVKSTGAMTDAASMTFTPTEPGDYTFFVDVRNSAGTTTTHTANVRVEAADAVRIADFQVTLADGGSAVFFGLPSGSVPRTGAAKVAVWAEGSSEASAVWYDLACDADGFWSAEVPLSSFGGTSYVCRVYGKTSSGSWQAGLERNFTLPLTPIMSSSQVDAQRLVAAYRNSGATYPAQAYASKGAPTIEEFCNIVVSEASAEGVDARVVFAQIMTETGWLRFGGDVKAEQCNFGGIGATGAGASGNSFTDVREGVRAQVQHLKAYASSAALTNPVVDPRYTYVSHGVMPYVEGLGTRWASGSSYGWDLASFAKSL